MDSNVGTVPSRRRAMDDVHVFPSYSDHSLVICNGTTAKQQRNNNGTTTEQTLVQWHNNQTLTCWYHIDYRVTLWSTRTLSALHALLYTVPPGGEVVLIPPTSTEDKGLTPPGLGVEREPLLGSVTCSSVHGLETNFVSGFHLWKSQVWNHVCRSLESVCIIYIM